MPATSTAGAVEGDEYSLDTDTQAVRVQNRTHIFRRDVAATETQRSVDPAGFKDAYAYTVQKATKAIARNIEATVFALITSATGTSAAARVMRSFQDPVFLVTATTSTEPNINTRDLGTATTVNAVLTEFDFNSTLETVYVNGGNPDSAYVSPATKRVVSGFTTNATASFNTRNIGAVEKMAVAAIDVYDSDFGLIQIILDRFVPQAADGSSTDYAGRVFFLERSKNRLAWLRPVQHIILGKSGDSVRGIVVGEVTLEVLNESANGYIRGVRNPSA